MTLWISGKALEELNVEGRTEILDGNGEPTGAYLSTGRDGRNPCIYGLFLDEDKATIWLNNLTITDDGDAVFHIQGQASEFIMPSRTSANRGRFSNHWEAE